MLRWLILAVAGVLVASTAYAHFVFVVPQKDGQSICVVFSDSLEPDKNVSIDKIAGAKLTAWFANDKQIPLECKKADHCLTSELSLGRPDMIYGTVVYGLSTKAKTPYLLVYHPKAVLNASTKSPTIGAKAELEIVPLVSDGKIKFRLLAAGQPVADAEGTVMSPEKKSIKITTDKEGYTQDFTHPGRYGVWLRHTVSKKGQHQGTTYEEVRRYATLVVDLADKGK